MTGPTVKSQLHMDDGAQAMLDQLNAGFPHVEEMTGPQARAAVAQLGEFVEERYLHQTVVRSATAAPVFF